MLAIFETHPVQYRAPVYQELQRLVPGRFHVFYATDISMRANGDVGFGHIGAWDEPLLEGYPNTILNQERGEPMTSFRSLHGCGLARVFNTHRPTAILQPQFFYEYDFAAFLQARIRGIPVWIRQETQDVAVQRSGGKAVLRSILYRILYSQVQKGFYIGELNRKHLLRHGFRFAQLIRAPYCTSDRFQNVADAEFTAIRTGCRHRHAIGPQRIVIGFFGKLIPKKNPDLLMRAVSLLKPEFKHRVTLLYVGSGELDPELRASAKQLEPSGVQTVFAGFINQSAIRDFYAATDIMVLPSRYAGETWGLVVNEALQAGCAVVVSEAVGSSHEFGKWERVRTIPVEDAPALARAFEQLAVFPRELHWAWEGMQAYTTKVAAEAIASEIRKHIA